MDRGHLPRHDLPATQHGTGEAITQPPRLALLRRFATGDNDPLRPRTAACLMLLYGQLLSRIIQLTTSDITTGDDGRLYLRLGTPPAPVPAPFAGILLQLAASSDAARGAGSHGSDWLFPGLHPGQPITYQAMLVQLRDVGLPMRTARTSALRQLVLQAPAPVVADALGFGSHHTTTQRQRANAGGTWNRYPGTRSDPPGTGPSPPP